MRVTCIPDNFEIRDFKQRFPDFWSITFLSNLIRLALSITNFSNLLALEAEALAVCQRWYGRI